MDHVRFTFKPFFPIRRCNNNTAVPQFPAAYDGVITVAATDLLDHKAPFSNYGESIAISAPGVNIISSYWGGYYSIASGTSFAAPMVAAEAALVMSLGINPDDVIRHSAISIDKHNPAYNSELGAGRIDLLRAVTVNSGHLPPRRHNVGVPE